MSQAVVLAEGTPAADRPRSVPQSSKVQKYLGRNFLPANAVFESLF
jgi:hypothetical protein